MSDDFAPIVTHYEDIVIFVAFAGLNRWPRWILAVDSVDTRLNRAGKCLECCQQDVDSVDILVWEVEVCQKCG